MGFAGDLRSVAELVCGRGRRDVRHGVHADRRRGAQEVWPPGSPVVQDTYVRIWYSINSKKQGRWLSLSFTPVTSGKGFVQHKVKSYGCRELGFPIYISEWLSYCTLSLAYTLHCTTSLRPEILGTFGFDQYSPNGAYISGVSGVEH